MTTTATYTPPAIAPPPSPPPLDHPPLIRIVRRFFGITFWTITITTSVTLTTAVGLTRSASARVVRTLHVLGARVLSTVAWFVWPTDSTPNKE